MITRIASLLLLLIFTAAAATAQEDSPLTEEGITGFIGSMAALDQWGDDHQDEIDQLEGLWNPESMEDMTNPFASAAEIILSQPWADEVVEIIESHGFDSIDSWADTGNRIFAAYVAIQMESNKSKMDAGMAEALKQIEASGLSEKQKEEMRKSLGAVGQMSQMYSEVPEADKQAVLPFVGALDDMGSSSE